MRIAAFGTLACWAAAASLATLWPSTVALRFALTFAALFSLLLVAHVVAFSLIRLRSSATRSVAPPLATSPREASSRREILWRATAAVAVAGLARLGLATQAPAVAGSFDIRALVPGAESDPPRIQRTYDAINRMVALIGDLPFDRLLRQPLKRLLPAVESRLDEAAERGLIERPRRIRRLGARVAELGGELTVADLFVLARTDMPKELIRTLVKLRREGIRVPLPGGERRRRARRRAVRRFLRVGGELTFQDLFLLSHDEVDAQTLEAARRLVRLGLLGWWSNDKCCVERSKKEPDKKDYCCPSRGEWCNLAGLGGAFCSISSAICKPANVCGPPP